MSMREREIEMFTGSENSSVMNTILFPFQKLIMFYFIMYFMFSAVLKCIDA